jgi:hypothetical protein
MNDRLDAVVEQINAVSDDVSTTFGPLSAEQVNWKLAADSWSIGQCLDHLIRTNSQFFPELEKLAAGHRKNSFWENYSPFTGLGGKYLIKMIGNDAKKIKAPSKDIVQPSDIEPNIVNRYVEHQDYVIEKLKATSAADPKKTVLTSPFMRLITYTLDDSYTIFIEHARRHVRQAKRVMEADGFPN